MKQEYLEDENPYVKAKKRVKKLKDLYSHIVAYIVLIPFWIFINYKTYWDFKWFWIPVVAMGVSIIVHALMIFKYNNNWEERKLKEFMDTDNF